MKLLRLLCAGGIFGALAAPACAQRAGVPQPVVTRHDLGILGIGTAGAAAISAFDVKIARFFAESTLHRRKLDVGAHRTSAVTETLLMISGASVWGLGRLSHSDATAEVALHLTESVASGAAFIQVIRGIGGRARPFVADDSGDVHDSNQYHFEFLHGFRNYDYRSFPSMHAMASFAAATALSQEMRVHRMRYREVAGPLLYLAASASPAARLYLDEHWASDVALGALIGIFAAQKTVNYSHAHSPTPVDRFLLKRETRIGVTAHGSRLSPLICVCSW